MRKETIRRFILNHYITRELFFILGRRKVNLKKIDRKLKNSKIKLSDKVVENCIVSLTSYGERILDLKYTLFSLITQGMRPEKIIVNISYEDSKLLNSDLFFFEQYGVEFYFCEDIRSFKKLIPTMQRFPNKTIVTVDDDMFYERTWLESLWNEHLKNPKMVVAHNIYEITYNNGQINTYNLWRHSIVINRFSYKNFFVGCGGVLYPPNSLYKDYDDKNLFQKLTPIADDIWFYFMTLLKGVKVTQPQKPHLKFHYVNPYREYGITKGKTLTQENVGLGKNDEQFRNVLNHYKISELDFIEMIEKEELY